MINTITQHPNFPAAAAAIAATTAVVVGAYLIAPPQGEPIIKPVLGQSVAVTSKKEGETAVYRSKKSLDKLVCSFPDFPEIKTYYDLWSSVGKRFRNSPLFGVRNEETGGKRGKYVFKTYGEAYDASIRLGRGLAAIGAQSQENIGIYSPNSEEWKIVEYGCYSASLSVVALYDTLGPKMVEYLLNHAEIAICFCAASTFDRIISACESTKTKVTTIILLQDVKDISRAEKLGIKIYTYKQILDLGESFTGVVKEPTPEDLCSIMYTSGTTGEPKGVPLTHAQMLSAITGYCSTNPWQHEVVPIYLSYLPLAHIMERMANALVIYFGGRIGFYSGDVKKLIEDIQTLEPTLFVGPPRIYQRIYTSIIGSVDNSGFVKKTLFNYAYQKKRHALAAGQSTPLLDKLVFNKIAVKVFGTRLKRCVTASAPLSKTVHEFFRVVFTPEVVEAYGATETTGAGTHQSIAAVQPGNVGPPVLSAEIKLVDVPEMGYFSTDLPCPRGEVCIRGPSIARGYYRNPEKSKEAFTEDGWYRTGDVGRLNADGTISIIDRAKNIFKLNQGEYVAPEYLETVYCRSPFVAQCFVYGDSLQPTLVAIVVPDELNLAAWAKKENVQGDFSALCRNPRVKQAILQDLHRVGKDAKLLGYELVKSIYVDNNPFTVDNNLLTPTLKLKRPESKAHYAKQIKDLYDEVNNE